MKTTRFAQESAAQARAEAQRFNTFRRRKQKVLTRVIVKYMSYSDDRFPESAVRSAFEAGFSLALKLVEEERRSVTH